MIQSVKFHNCKALRDVSLEIDARLTVIVGPNGSGKTTCLKEIEGICGNWSTQSLSAKVGDELERDDRSGIEVHWKQLDDSDGECVFGGNSTIPPSKPEKRIWFNRLQKYLTNSSQIPDELRLSLSSVRLLRLNSEALARASRLKSVPPAIEINGNGLPSVLAYLQRREPSRFDSIVAKLKKVISNVRGLRMDYVHQGSEFSDGILFDFVGAEKIPAHEASIGTLYVLGLLAVLMGPNPPSVLLLDDIDQGLHPKAQFDLIEVLRTIMSEYPDLQIIATSHSPFILDRLKPEEVRCSFLKLDGFVSMARLAEHPDFAKWKDVMTPGEFWTHVGEDWIGKLGRRNVEVAAKA